MTYMGRNKGENRTISRIEDLAEVYQNNMEEALDAYVAFCDMVEDVYFKVNEHAELCGGTIWFTTDDVTTVRAETVADEFRVVNPDTGDCREYDLVPWVRRLCIRYLDERFERMLAHVRRTR